MHGQKGHPGHDLPRYSGESTACAHRTPRVRIVGQSPLALLPADPPAGEASAPTRSDNPSSAQAQAPVAPPHCREGSPSSAAPAALLLARLAAAAAADDDAANDGPPVSASRVGSGYPHMMAVNLNRWRARLCFFPKKIHRGGLVVSIPSTQQNALLGTSHSKRTRRRPRGAAAAATTFI